MLHIISLIAGDNKQCLRCRQLRAKTFVHLCIRFEEIDYPRSHSTQTNRGTQTVDIGETDGTKGVMKSIKYLG